jgi:phage-related protein
MAELGEWTCSYNGLVMGEPDSAVSIVQVDGLLTLPEVRSSDLELVQRNGLWAGDDYLNGRTVTLTLEVYGTDPDSFGEALSDVVAAFQPGGDEKPLRFLFPGLAGNLTAYVKARPRKRSGPLDLHFAYNVCNVVIELFCTDPYIYADADRTVTALTPVGNVDTRVRLTANTAVTALPVITVTGAKNLHITDEITGDTFGVTYTGNYTIDSAAQKVTTSTGLDITGLITAGSVWPEFVHGEHRLALTHDDAANAAQAVYTWRGMWV